MGLSILHFLPHNESSASFLEFSRIWTRRKVEVSRYHYFQGNTWNACLAGF